MKRPKTAMSGGDERAHPFWAFSAMRRRQILHRSPWKLDLGFGASFQTQIDLLDAMKRNFAYLLAFRMHCHALSVR